MDSGKQAFGPRAQFDALHDLSNQAWRDWEHKASHEWRPSIAIWTALLGASALLIANTSLTLPPLLFVAGGTAVLSMHVAFLAWVQGRLKDSRREYQALRSRMPPEVRPETPRRVERRWYQSNTDRTQAGITLLLLAVLMAVATH